MAADYDSRSLLALYLLDLRAQYELELRTLTALQRDLEEARASQHGEDLQNASVTMGQRLAYLIRANETIGASLRDASRQVQLLGRPDAGAEGS